VAFGLPRFLLPGPGALVQRRGRDVSH
jgi:hypothetical protein